MFLSFQKFLRSLELYSKLLNFKPSLAVLCVLWIFVLFGLTSYHPKVQASVATPNSGGNCVATTVAADSTAGFATKDDCIAYLRTISKTDFICHSVNQCLYNQLCTAADIGSLPSSSASCISQPTCSGTCQKGACSWDQQSASGTCNDINTANTVCCAPVVCPPNSAPDISTPHLCKPDSTSNFGACTSVGQCIAGHACSGSDVDQGNVPSISRPACLAPSTSDVAADVATDADGVKHYSCPANYINTYPNSPSCIPAPAQVSANSSTFFCKSAGQCVNNQLCTSDDIGSVPSGTACGNPSAKCAKAGTILCSRTNTCLSKLDCQDATVAAVVPSTELVVGPGQLNNSTSTLGCFCQKANGSSGLCDNQGLCCNSAKYPEFASHSVACLVQSQQCYQNGDQAFCQNNKPYACVNGKMTLLNDITVCQTPIPKSSMPPASCFQHYTQTNNGADPALQQKLTAAGCGPTDEANVLACLGITNNGQPITPADLLTTDYSTLLNTKLSVGASQQMIKISFANKGVKSDILFSTDGSQAKLNPGDFSPQQRIDIIKQQLNSGSPVILGITINGTPHYVLAIGYNEATKEFITVDSFYTTTDSGTIDKNSTSTPTPVNYSVPTINSAVVIYPPPKQ